VHGRAEGELDSPECQSDDMSAPDPAQWTLPDLRVDLNGDWFDSGVQVTHPGILANLRSNLRHDAEGYFIQTRVRIPVEVEDAPFTVARIERRGADLFVVLNDETEETVDRTTLRMGAAGVPYCRVKKGAFEARLTRAATYQLLAMAETDDALRAQLGQ
jgi:uncharacterized protein